MKVLFNEFQVATETRVWIFGLKVRDLKDLRTSGVKLFWKRSQIAAVTAPFCNFSVMRKVKASTKKVIKNDVYIKSVSFYLVFMKPNYRNCYLHYFSTLP